MTHANGSYGKLRPGIDTGPFCVHGVPVVRAIDGECRRCVHGEARAAASDAGGGDAWQAGQDRYERQLDG